MFIVIINSSITGDTTIVGPYDDLQDAREHSYKLADEFIGRMNHGEAADWDFADDNTDDYTVTSNGVEDVSFEVSEAVDPRSEFTF